MDNVADLIGKYGFPVIAAAGGMGFHTRWVKTNSRLTKR